ncbi:DUF4252 domain-containing protein [Dinghuibacter silviterrae]|uniref:Uncharacterized protein DUF4252 n=1 Tax=Dinghuibacter silviterrae TaxID=1539049 RepID=A0A4R8DFT2_9BACT|nr:DUF4252 domain-containing protein [Dinghuibacter silviterrae]TDW95956.1 uncharacterized protein DUF4252 [Dinghuibacter silviterrae]
MKRMIRKGGLLALALLMGSAVFAQDDAIGKFFGKYIDDDRFTVVSVSPKMFRLLSSVNWDTVSPNIRQAVQKLQSLRILSTETTPMTFYKEALAKIDRSQYEELITVRDKEDNTRFLVREDGKVIHELLMISVDGKDFTLLSFVGDIDLDALSKLSSDMKIQGLSHLKDAKKP